MAYLTVNPIVYRINPDQKLVVTYTTDSNVVNVMLTLNDGENYIPCESCTQTQAVFDISGYKSGIYEECFIRGDVKIAVETITLTPDRTTIKNLDPITIVHNVLPEDAYDKSVTWSSTNERIATVLDGVVTPLRTGNTTIICTSVSNPSVKETCVVDVDLSNIRIPCQLISFDKTTIKITDSMPVKLTAILEPDNTTDTIDWSVSPTDIIALNKVSNMERMVTPLKSGSCVITAVCNGKSATCGVSIEGLVLRPCTGLEINPITASIKVGETLTISASVTPTDTTDALIWTTSAPNIATVDNGVVTPVLEGSCVITATCGSYSQECNLVVAPEFDIPNNAIASYTGSDCNWYIVNEPYDVAVPEDYFYPFVNNDGWITSTNKNHDYTYSMCKLHIEVPVDTGFVLTAMVSGEQYYDYAIFSLPNVPLLQSDDEDTQYHYSSKEEDEIATRVVYNLKQGVHDIWIKYRKDSSNSGGDDTLMFKVAGTQPYSAIPETALMSEISDDYYWYAENLDISASDLYDWDIYNDSYGVQHLRSTNYNINNSSAICRVVFNSERPLDVKFKVSMDSEETFDVLFFSKPNQIYNSHYGADAGLDRDKYSGSIGIQYVHYDLPAGKNVIYLKYFKDTSTHAEGDRCYVTISEITVK